MSVTSDNLPAVIADEQHDLLSAENAGAYMEASLSRAIMWLADVERIEEVIHQKAAAEAITTFIREKELGHDAELHGAEIVRRCEYRIGQLVRQGQERGEIRRQGQSRAQYQRGHNKLIASPTDYLPQHVLVGGGRQPGLYDMADGVTDEDFESALKDARAEGNLSRANVVRKVRARKGQPEPEPERSEWHHRKRRIDSNRILSESVTMLDGIVASLALVDFTALDKERVGSWSASLRESLSQLRRFGRELENGQ